MWDFDLWGPDLFEKVRTILKGPQRVQKGSDFLRGQDLDVRGLDRFPKKARTVVGLSVREWQLHSILMGPMYISLGTLSKPKNTLLFHSLSLSLLSFSF